VKRKCDKQAYRTKDDARRAIATMGSKWRFVYKRIYRCADCKAYHITSRPSGRSRKRKQW
jgi:hypothetical protein